MIIPFTLKFWTFSYLVCRLFKNCAYETTDHIANAYAIKF